MTSKGALCVVVNNNMMLSLAALRAEPISDVVAHESRDSGGGGSVVVVGMEMYRYRYMCTYL